jgi:hypothetical protein
MGEVDRMAEATKLAEHFRSGTFPFMISSGAFSKSNLGQIGS